MRKDWTEKLRTRVAQMDDSEKEHIIKTLSQVRRTKYLEYLITTFNASPELANKIRQYYKIPINQNKNNYEKHV